MTKPKWVDRKPEIRKFTPTESSWLASAIDGEGSIGLYNYGREGRRVCIQMANTNKEYVDEFRRIIGCGSQINRNSWHKSHFGRKTMFLYCLKGSNRCYWVLKQVVNFLIIKKSKALKIIKEIEETPFGIWKNKTSENRKRASIRTRMSWKNPTIRANRLLGMKNALGR